MLVIAPDLHISEYELEERYIRSSGPGGQNVNKVSTAVQIRFDVLRSPSLPEDVRERLLKIAANRITTDGVLVIEAKRYRTRERNRQDARERLSKLIHRALFPPKPRKRTKPTRASKLKRLEDKKHRSRLKKLRRNTD